MHPGKRCRASHIWSGCERRDTSPMSEWKLRLLMTFGALMNDWLHGRSLCPLGGAPLTCSPSCMHACRTLTLALALGSRSRCVINAFSHSPSVPASQSHLLTLARCALARCALALARSLAQALVSLARSRSLTCSCARCSHSLARLLVRLLVRLLAALSLARMHVCAVLWLAALSLIALVRAALSLARSRSLRSRALCSRSLTRLRALRPPSLARAHCALARSQLCCPRTRSLAHALALLGSLLHLPQ